MSDEAYPSGGLNLSQMAYNAISAMIRQRKLRGNEAIVETRLAEVLGLSRTPLREALQRLEGEGLVVKGGNRSFVVRHVGLAEYLQSLRCRFILEGEAASLAVGHIPRIRLAEVRHEIETLAQAAAYHTDAHWRSDDNIHGLLTEFCQNEVLGDLIKRLRVTTRLFEIARLSDRVEPDAAEHQELLGALEQEDGRAARRAAQAHIRSLMKFALQTVR